MSGLRRRLVQRLGLGGDATRTDELTRRLDDSDARTRGELERQEALLRELATDLTERVAALERRIGALESRDR